MIKAKIVLINQIISEITSNIKNSIDSTGEVYISTNIGKATGIPFLVNFGPQISMRLQTSRTELKQSLLLNLEKVE